MGVTFFTIGNSPSLSDCNLRLVDGRSTVTMSPSSNDLVPIVPFLHPVFVIFPGHVLGGNEFNPEVIDVGAYVSCLGSRSFPRFSHEV